LDTSGSIYRKLFSKEAELKFIEATELTQEKIEEVETRVRRRVLRWLTKKGLLENTEAEDMLGWDQRAIPRRVCL
jgi:hypothetical protein